MDGLAGSRLAAPDRLDRPFSDPLVAQLFPPLATGVHWGLERTERALEALGKPHLSYRTLHVGGTNGKGSVVSTLSSVLNTAGTRTACFTSPHLCSFRERLLVGGEPLSEQEILQCVNDVRDVVMQFGLTFFEAITVLGLYAFARAGVEAAVLEVGLGGRLDATNVIRPDVAAVTNVAMDHAEYLGDTLEKIAREKAAIAKPGVPLVTAETSPALLAVFREVAAGVGAPLVVVDPSSLGAVEVAADHTSFTLDTHTWGGMHVQTPLVGRHQAVNAALAVKMLDVLPVELRPSAEAIREGIGAVEYHGRDQIVLVDGATWLLDVAHNTAGMRSLVDTIDRLDLPRPLVAVVGVLGDKDWRMMLPPLFSRTDVAFLTQPPSAPLDRRWSVAEAAAAVGTITHVVVEDDFERALDRAKNEVGQGTIIVTGSVHTVGSALKILGLEPLGSR